jgi:hypothetical protein
MALNPDDYFGDGAASPAEPAPAAKPRYAPAPKTPQEADARLAEVQAATAELDAWADSKRQKKGLGAIDRAGREGAGGKPSTSSVPGVVSTPENFDEAVGGPKTAQPVPARQAAPESKPARSGPLNPDDYFEAAPPPAAPKKPGMLARAGEFLAAGRSKPDPTLAGITKEQAAGMLPEEAASQPAPGQPEQQSLARQPWEADTRPVDQRRRGRFAEQDPRRTDVAFNPGPKGSVLDKPQALDYPALLDMAGRNAADQQAGSMSPERAAREQADAQQAQRDKRPYAEAKPLELTNEISEAIRASTKNPAARGVVSGLSEMGKVGTGAVRLLSDVIGADELADFAKKAENKAGAISRGATQDLSGNDKLAADIFASVVSSAPPLVLGVAGAGQRAALNTLMVQTTLQEYGAGRDAGFGIGESLSRAMIMGYAERLGEQFDFMPQVKALKALVKKTSTEELAKLAGEVLVKNIPGEELTTTIQFLADKVGPAALRPDATMGDYLEAVAETFKVAVGQSLLMAGGPAAIKAGGNALARADQVSGLSTPEVLGRLRQRDLQDFVEPQGDMPPTEARGASLQRFDELAAQFGFNPKAVARAKEAANQMPAGDVPGFLAKLADTLQSSGLSQKPIDEASLRALRQTVDAASAESGAPQESAPQEEAPQEDAPAAPASASADDYTGLDETLDRQPVQAGDLMTGDGQPYGTRAGATARANKDGGEVVAVPGGWVVRPAAQAAQSDGQQPTVPQPDTALQGPANDQPNLAVPAAQPADPADGPGVQSGGSGGTVGPVSAAPEPVDRPAAAPAAGAGPAQAVADGGGADAALTDIPALKRAWSAAAAAGNTEEARRLNDLIVAAKAAQAGGAQDAPAPAPVPAPEAAAPAATEPRVIGRYGRTPKASSSIELRPNADGTWTPFDGKYEMLDYESGEPIVLPANVTDAQAAAAIRAAGSIGEKDKFYGVKPDPAPESNVAPAPDSAAEGAPSGGSAEPAPGAATLQQPIEQQRAAAQQRVDGLRALLKCLQS